MWPAKNLAVIKDTDGDVHPVGVSELPKMVAAADQPNGVQVECDVSADGALAPDENTLAENALSEVVACSDDESESSDDEDASAARKSSDDNEDASAALAAAASADGDLPRAARAKRHRDTRGVDEPPPTKRARHASPAPAPSVAQKKAKKKKRAW